MLIKPTLLFKTTKILQPKKLRLFIFASEGKVNNVFGISKWEIVFQVEVTNSGRIFELNRPLYQHNSLEAPRG